MKLYIWAEFFIVCRNNELEAESETDIVDFNFLWYLMSIENVE